MTTSLTALTQISTPDLPSIARTDPWVGLTEDDATRIAAALAATHAESTRKVYAFAWRRWVRWCSGRGIVAFPAEPAAVCAYLTECAEQGLSLATIDSACSAIGHQHRHHGKPDPIDHDAVRQVRRGLRRIIGRAPRRPTRPLSVADVRQIVTAIDRTTVRGVRDSAILLLGFAGALRRSEVAALTLADLEAKPGGLLLHLRRSKTDQEGRGQVVGIANGQHPLTDPIAAIDAWLALRGTAPGPVFTNLRQGGPMLRPISGNAVSVFVKERALAAASPTVGSAATRCAPVTPPAPPWPASVSTGSPPRPGTVASTSSSSATSAPSRRCRRPPAATSDYDVGMFGLIALVR